MLQHCACPPIAASLRVMANSVSRRSLQRSALFEGDYSALFPGPV
jgi:hypothetical protein